MKFKNFKTIVSAALLGLSGAATAADIEFYLPNDMVNNYPGGGAKLFVVTIDGKSCKIGWKKSACTVYDVEAYSSVARVDWYNAGYTFAKDLIASTAFVVRYKNPDTPYKYGPEENFSSIPLPVGKVRINELNGVNPGAAANNIGLYLVPSNDLLKLPVITGKVNVNLPSNYFAGLKHYEMTPSAISWSTWKAGNEGMELPVLAGTYTPIAYQVNGGAAYAKPHFLSEEQAVVVGMGTTTEIHVDATGTYLPMDIHNNQQEPTIVEVDE